MRALLRALRPFAIVATVTVCLGGIACGGTGPRPNAASDEASRREAARQEAERLWKGKCGACHVRVPPGTRSRGTIEAAATRHRKRVRMTEPQWANLVEFLAPQDAAAARTSDGR
jgi:hypothetical protein